MSSLITLPSELRHKILASVIWAPTAAPLYNLLDLFHQDPPRIRLRDDWDIWVPATTPQPPALPLLLTCRILRDDVQYLLLQSTAPRTPYIYEIDIVFIPKCGLFPTWVCYPLPNQFHLDTLRASFRIMDVDDIKDMDVDDKVQGKEEFLRRYHGISSNFDVYDNKSYMYPNPPPGSWNFYRLLVSFLALGPRGLCSPAYQRENRGSLLLRPPPPSPRPRPRPRYYSLRHLIISVTSKGQEETETEMDEDEDEDDSSDEERWVGRGGGQQRFLLASNDDLPYGAGGEAEIFPGPPPPPPPPPATSINDNNNNDNDEFSQSQSQSRPSYTWTGPTDLQTVRGMHIDAGRDTLGHADRYGLYLANTLWALLDFDGSWLSRGFGLMLYESILDDITFYVDGEPRPRFGMDDLLLLFLPSFLQRQADPPIRKKLPRTLTPEAAAALEVWKEWVVKWRMWRRKEKLQLLREEEGSSSAGSGTGSGVLLDDTYTGPEPEPPRPTCLDNAFVRYLPASNWDYDPNEPSESSDSDDDADDDADKSIAEE